jgi:pilus assembly protein FimV
MSEVGTKLDLARAYIDMGDPEGARSILDEVLKEGNPGQRKQAEKLLGGLP